ncbi:MAG: ECF transporter S component [Ardenticatenia bacterium]|nr:ECF transporter S component [Ardenticatenia bacterium]
MIRQFNTLTLALIPVAVVINIVMGQIIVVLKLPLYLDSIGTVLVGALAGPLAGGLTGALANIVWGLFTGPTIIPFAITAFVIGVLAGQFARAGWLRPSPTSVIVKAMFAGLITGIVAAVVSAPIAALLFGGVTGAGTDALVAFFQSMGANVIQATLGQGLVSDPLDKTITFIVVWLILRAMPRRQVARFPQGDHVLE